jgi:catechol 2,3-dioxygenase-like lactoylglutathione lyase family enzyme
MQGSTMSIRISALDHVVLNVADVETSAGWYLQVLGMKRKDFEPAPGKQRRTSLSFGNQKLNLRRVPVDDLSHAFKTDALCFLTETTPDGVVGHLEQCGVTIVEGPVEKHGAVGMLISVYCRDPDGRLIEIAAYED